MRNIKKTSLFSRAYIRDQHFTYFDDAMLIAVLAHTSGRSRESYDATVVRKLMGDINLDED